MYRPFDQSYRLGADPARTLARRGAALIEGARAASASVDPTMPILFNGMLREQTKLALTVFEMAAGVLSVFGVMAMGLAALGTYGLIAYPPSRARTRSAFASDRRKPC